MAVLLIVSALWLVVGLRYWPVPTEIVNTGMVFVNVSGVRVDGTLDAIGTQRLLAAIGIANGRTLILSRGIEHGRTTDSGQRHLLDSMQFNGPVVTLPGIAPNTRGEALAVRARYPELDSLAVVTTAIHARRSCATFRRLGFRVCCVSAGREGPWWQLPYLLAYEQAAMVLYRWRGWV